MSRKIYTAFDLPPDVVRSLLESYTKGIVTEDQLDAFAASLRTSLSAAAPFRAVQSDAGALTLDRKERFMYLEVSDKAGSGVATLDTISGTGWADQDLLTVRPAGVSGLTVTSGGNIQPMKSDPFSLNGKNQFSVLAYSGGTFYEVYRVPAADVDLIFTEQEAHIQSGTVTLPGPLTVIYGEATGAADATGGFTVAGVSGNDFVSIQALGGPAGDSPLLANAVSVSGSLATHQVAELLRDAVNAGTGAHGFTASYSGSDVTITAPAGSGAGGNSYTLSVTTEAANVSFTGVTGFAGGSSGTAGNDELVQINGLVPGQVAFVRNGMSDHYIRIGAGGNIRVNDPLKLEANSGALIIQSSVGVHFLKSRRDDNTAHVYEGQSINTQTAGLPAGYRVRIHPGVYDEQIILKSLKYSIEAGAKLTNTAGGAVLTNNGAALSGCVVNFEGKGSGARIEPDSTSKAIDLYSATTELVDVIISNANIVGATSADLVDINVVSNLSASVTFLDCEVVNTGTGRGFLHQSGVLRINGQTIITSSGYPIETQASGLQIRNQWIYTGADYSVYAPSAVTVQIAQSNANKGKSPNVTWDVSSMNVDSSLLP